jgi:metallophosphoesterase (TIGR00282 family)
MIGDIVGRPGRAVVKQQLGELRRQREVQLCVANAENTAGGSGLTPALAGDLFSFGIDCLTMGDHVFRRKELVSYLQAERRLVRPANFPPEAPGRGWTVLETEAGVRVAVINLLGRVFMNPIECPFHAVDDILGQLAPEVKVILVDMHAEATSEKVALGWYLDGRVSAVVGTHTHVATADARVLPGGTAYITDLGMTGPYESVLGVRTDRVLRSIITRVPASFEVAKGDVRLSGVLVAVDEVSGKASSIERIERQGLLAEEDQSADRNCAAEARAGSP